MLSGPAPGVVWRIALWLVATALCGGPALAGETANGSKNFSPPTTVPNYFSNEAGPMLGGTAESRRGELFPSQLAGAQGVRPAATAAAPTPAAAAPAARQHIAMAEPKGHLVRSHGRIVAHHVAVHGHSHRRVAAHGSSRHHVTRAASKTRVTTSTHHHVQS